MRRAVFGIPGDLETVTGGYLYEKRLLLGLREAGTATAHLRLGASFPDPSAADLRHAIEAFDAVPATTPLILDGFVFGSFDPDALARVRAPVVGVVHHPLAYEEGLSDERRAHLYRTERANLRVADAVLTPSGFTARILIEEYGADPARITVCRPGTDAPEAGPRIPDDPPLILSVGIQHPRKGHDILLRALAEIGDLPWRAVIVGSPYDGGHARALQRLRADLGLDDRVRFTGLVSTAERERLSRRASVFALATRFEGYGLVFDEALAHGLPIISCRTGAVPDTVPSDAGVLVPPEDPRAFAAALRRVLTDDGARSQLASASARAGAALPSWLDTATTAQRVLDALG